MIVFRTTRSPVWGDFYAKDGTDDQNDVYAYNSGLSDDPTDGPADGSISYHILRPDTVTTRVPEPLTLIILGVGLVSTAGLKRLVRKGD